MIVKPEWLDKIYEDKDHEIRGQPCHSKKGKRIYFCPSEESAVTGTAILADCLGPLTQAQFDQLRPRHKVPGASQYAKTYAWVLKQTRRLEPRPIVRKHGSVVWQIGPGGA